MSSQKRSNIKTSSLKKKSIKIKKKIRKQKKNAKGSLNLAKKVQSLQKIYKKYSKKLYELAEKHQQIIVNGLARLDKQEIEELKRKI